MNDNLNRKLASAKQQYEELTHLIPLSDICDLKLGEGAKRKRIEFLLKSLNDTLAAIDRELRSEGEVPIAQLGASQIKFFRQHLEPSAPILRRAYWECIDLRDLFEQFDEYQPPHPREFVKDAIACSLERWRDMLDEDELSDLLSRGIAIDSAIETVELPWFEPDRWRENMRLLRPVLLDRPPQHVRDHVRHRLTEIYRSFTFGLWMSSVALCRSLLEYSLKETAQTFGIERTKPGYRGLPEDKSMKQLCDEFSAQIPSLATALEQVRDAGNRIMHARRNDVIAYPKVLREEALESIRAMRQSLEIIYARTCD